MFESQYANIVDFDDEDDEDDVDEGDDELDDELNDILDDMEWEEAPPPPPPPLPEEPAIQLDNHDDAAQDQPHAPSQGFPRVARVRSNLTTMSQRYNVGTRGERGAWCGQDNADM